MALEDFQEPKNPGKPQKLRRCISQTSGRPTCMGLMHSIMSGDDGSVEYVEEFPVMALPKFTG